MIKRAFKYGLLAILALIAWLGLVEILIRTFFPQAAMLHQLDATYGYIGIPGKAGWYPSRFGEYKIKIRMNREGFRAVDHEMEAPDGVYRILFLGDSYTESKEVELDETYWRRLLKSLPTLPDGRILEVINMGVSGFGTGEELLLLRNKGLAYKPDLVVIGLTEHTDVWNNSRYLDTLSDGRDPNAMPMKPYFVPDADTLDIYPFKIHSLDEGGLRWFRRNFQTYMYLRNLSVANPGLLNLAYKLKLVRTPPAPEKIAWKHPVFFDAFRTDLNADTHWVQAWSMTQRLFLEIQKSCLASGADLLVLMIPYPHQVYEEDRQAAFQKYPDLNGLPLDWEKVGRGLNPFFDQAGIDHLHLHFALKKFAERNPADRLYFKMDMHFAPRGHEVVSQLLKQKIEEKIAARPHSFLIDTTPDVPYL